MLRVGLTGNIGSGKSTVARMWRARGAAVIDADALARRAVAPGSAGLARIAEEFGPGVLAGDGTLDRAALRDVVFRDAGRRRRLEAIVHPEVERLRRLEEERLEEAGARLVVHEVPLLFEVGLDAAMDVVVFVDAPAAVRRERIIRTRGLAPDEADRMIHTQEPAAEKRERADIVIENAGDIATLEERADEAWKELERRAGSG